MTLLQQRWREIEAALKEIPGGWSFSEPDELLDVFLAGAVSALHAVAAEAAAGVPAHLAVRAVRLDCVEMKEQRQAGKAPSEKYGWMK